MSNTIQLEPIETDVAGWGSDYYRRKQEPTEPYYVENLNFDDAVQKEFPNRDAEVEQYLLNQAYKRGQDTDRPFQRELKVPDWAAGGEKVRTEHWDPGSFQRTQGELGHYEKARHHIWEEDGKEHEFKTPPTIRMFNNYPPYIHEAAHHLQKDQVRDPRIKLNIPSNGLTPDGWYQNPEEIQADASLAKRRYVHEYQLYPHATKELQPLDRNHPAVKEGKPIPEEHIDNMFDWWMIDTEDSKWGAGYNQEPEDFPVEMFKEALRLGKNDQKPAGMFTGRGPQNA
jgi:hypothetical protein